jgi:hypothetical protein
LIGGAVGVASMLYIREPERDRLLNDYQKELAKEEAKKKEKEKW